MSIIDLIYYAAAAWYLSYVLTNKSGPFAVFKRIRDLGGGRWHGRKTFIVGHIHGMDFTSEKETRIDGLLDCVVCLIVWVALIMVAIGHNIVFDAFAVAGVALFLHSFTGWRMNI